MATHLTEFLGLVLPWDGPDASSIKLIGTVYEKAPGEKTLAHAGATSLPELERLIQSRMRFQTDVYIALGAFKQAYESKTRDGFLKAARTAQNVERMRSLFFDIDVGKKDKVTGAPVGYQTTAGAYAELARFQHESGMPAPTVIVESGSGGLHVYWSMHAAVAQDRWRPMAMALLNAARLHKFEVDTTRTADAASVLRPPTTFNYKTTPPNPVRMGQPGVTYAPEALEAALARYMGPRLVATQPAAHIASSALPAGPAGMAANAGAAQNFTANAPVGGAAPPVDIYALADAGCGVFAEALDTGGANHQQPLWHLLMLAATFDTDPDEVADAMSSGYPGSSWAQTEQMLRRKQAERAAKPQLGWPSCQQFSLHSPICQTCPHLGAGKTPFHLAPRPSQTPPPAQADFPLGYWRMQNNTVWGEVTTKDGAKRQLQILDYSVISGALREDTGALVFKALVGGDPVDVEVPSASTISAQETARALSLSGIMLRQHQQPLVKEFTVAWTQKLQEMKLPRLRPAAMGWTDADEFVYGGKTHGKNGAVDAYVPDAQAIAPYTPRGNLQPWKDAMAIVHAQGSPALESIVAAGFAGPLVKMTGHSGMLFSAFSIESGAGKTTAMRISQAIFGHPTRALNSLSDTENAVMKKISDLRNLTLNWDELKTQSEIDKFISVAFRLGQGKDKARLTRDARQQEVGVFHTLLCTCSNDSLADRLTRATQSTAAGAVRCFEVYVSPIQSTYSTSYVAQQVAKLETNYGQAGMLYAAYLGANHATVKAAVEKMQTTIEKHLGASREERFWVATMSVLIVGAQLANTLSLTQFNINALYVFLAQSYAKLRADRADNVVDMTTATDVEALLQRFVAETYNKHLIVTNQIWRKPGRPGPQAVTIVGMADRVQHPWAQLGSGDNVLRVVVSDFNHWLVERKMSPNTVMKQIQQRMQVDRLLGSIGSGTAQYQDSVARLRARVYDIHLPAAVQPPSAHTPGSSLPTTP